LALGMWFLSGVSGWGKRAAWWVAVGCFSLFGGITLYKGITGAASCGCFGRIHVNPWVTLLAIDAPAVLGLLFLPVRSDHTRLTRLSFSLIANIITILILVNGSSTVILALNPPPLINSRYEVLIPDDWPGKPFPYLEHIDIASRLSQGTWAVFLYHHDCPNCRTALPQYHRMARDLSSNGNSSNRKTPNDCPRLPLLDVFDLHKLHQNYFHSIPLKGVRCLGHFPVD
jgi:hypothetical protein